VPVTAIKMIIAAAAEILPRHLVPSSLTAAISRQGYIGRRDRQSRSKRQSRDSKSF
jgi:hypothetical protein